MRNNLIRFPFPPTNDTRRLTAQAVEQYYGGVIKQELQIVAPPRAIETTPENRQIDRRSLVSRVLDRIARVGG